MADSSERRFSRSPAKREEIMETVYDCCCGLDVHATTVVACLIKGGKKEIRTYSTMTDELLTLSDSVVRNRLRKEPERENLYGGLSVVPRTQGVVLRASG